MKTDKTMTTVHLQTTLACHVENVFTIDPAACELTWQATFSDKPRVLPPGTIGSLIWCTAQCNNSYPFFSGTTDYWRGRHNNSCHWRCDSFCSWCCQTTWQQWMLPTHLHWNCSVCKCPESCLTYSSNSLNVNTIGSKQFLWISRNVWSKSNNWLCVEIWNHDILFYFTMLGVGFFDMIRFEVSPSSLSTPIN